MAKTITLMDAQGVYHYKFRLRVYPVPTFGLMTLRVHVYGETDLAYYVKFLQFHADGRKPGTTTRVQKRLVKLDQPAAAPEAPAIRLPYKDND